MEIVGTCPYPVRAWWDAELLAESDAAVEATGPDGRPVLCFPLSDVRLELFYEEASPLDGEGGPARSWSSKLPVPRRWPAAGGWGDPEPARDDARFVLYKGTASYWNAVVGGGVVRDVAWSYEDPLPESLPIRGLLGFDPARAEVDAELPSGLELL